MTSSNNSIIATAPRRFAPIVRLRPAMAALLLIVVTVASGGQASAAADETDARAIFLRFVAAQNAHNASDVRAMLWNSPNMLSVTRGVQTRGADAVAARFKGYYEGTWHLEPDMAQFHAATISNDVMQILVPILFTRGLPGKPPQDNTFLISQTFVREGDGWFVASIFPVANTEIK